MISKTAKTNYGLKRLLNKILLNCSKSGLLPNKIRITLVQLAGVNFVNSSSVFIGDDISFDNIYPEDISIGNNVRITSGTKILTHFLDTTKPPFNFYRGKVIIGDNVFIGANTIISKECIIGNNSVIAAGSVITKSVAENWIVGGVPAKKISERKKGFSKLQ